VWQGAASRKVADSIGLYSDAFSVAKMDDLALLNPVDAWHPSLYGHGELADTVCPVVYQQAQLLGWDEMASR